LAPLYVQRGVPLPLSAAIQWVAVDIVVWGLCLCYVSVPEVSVQTEEALLGLVVAEGWDGEVRQLRRGQSIRGAAQPTTNLT
jgi:hypothetical protein